MKKIVLLFTIITFAILSFVDADNKSHFTVIRGNITSPPSVSFEVQKININTASIDELDKLSGIGPALAERIIAYREKQPFKTIDDIMKVKGIGNSKYNTIKDLISVN